MKNHWAVPAQTERKGRTDGAAPYWCKQVTNAVVAYGQRICTTCVFKLTEVVRQNLTVVQLTNSPPATNSILRQLYSVQTRHHTFLRSLQLISSFYTKFYQEVSSHRVFQQSFIQTSVLSFTSYTPFLFRRASLNNPDNICWWSNVKFNSNTASCLVTNYTDTRQFTQ